jgi:hypothetical protein
VTSDGPGWIKNRCFVQYLFRYVGITIIVIGYKIQMH